MKGGLSERLMAIWLNNFHAVQDDDVATSCTTLGSVVHLHPMAHTTNTTAPKCSLTLCNPFSIERMKEGRCRMGRITLRLSK